MSEVIELDSIDQTQLGAPQVVPMIWPSVPLGISGDSSISPASKPAEGIWAAIARPFSLPRTPNYMFALLNIEQRMTKTLEKEGTQLEAEIKSDLKRLEVLNREKIDMLKSHAEALKSQAQWNAWQAVTEYVAYSGSIALGLACFSSGVGVTPGLFLIASGVIGLVNRVGADSGAWRWTASYITANQERQQHLAQAFDSALTATAIALSILGAYGIYYAHVYERLAMSSLEVAMNALNTAAIGLQLTQKAGESYHHSRSLEIQAALKHTQERTTALQTEISMDTAEIQKMFKLSGELDKVIQMAIASQQQG